MVDKIGKLFKKISLPDRKRLLQATEKLVSGSRTGFKTQKVKDTDFYKIRIGKFRIIFHYEKEVVVVDAIRMRDDNTYKDL
ncbi:type II toxin-antitoxin system RelE/ParE family toxin [Candidatus Kuenenbacteria bacterium]|nr:type II toxin-antitoxin system RelE/ParE family toxin [Candidatus Kuenenbacteria bacterium]